jgi:hypothetical protein
MEISYLVSVELDAEHNRENLRLIFQQGLELGFIYYAKPCDQFDGYHSIAANSMQVTDFILKFTDKSLTDHSDAYFATKFENTDFLITAHPNDGRIRISILDFGDPWIQLIDNQVGTIDFARYIRLMLALCKDFSILKINTFAG